MGQSINTRRGRSRRPVWLIAVAALLAVVLAIGVATMLPHGGTAPSANSGDVPAPTIPAKTLPRDFIDRNTASRYVVLADVTNGRLLYTKNEQAKCYPASLTKLLTSLVALGTCSADTAFTVGDEIRMIDPQSSKAYLTEGTRLTLEQLLYAMLLPSGNDAAYVTAVGVGRLLAGDAQLDKQAALTRFVAEMNTYAARLGCTGSHFANPDGIHQEDHYTTAADMLKIATAALSDASIAQVVAQPTVTLTLLSGQTVKWESSNRLLRTDTAYYYEGAIGVKTGSTDEAGRCLVAAAVRDGRTSVVVLMGAADEAGRWEDARGLLDISFQ